MGGWGFAASPHPANKIANPDAARLHAELFMILQPIAFFAVAIRRKRNKLHLTGRRAGHADGPPLTTASRFFIFTTSKFLVIWETFW